MKVCTMLEILMGEMLLVGISEIIGRLLESETMMNINKETFSHRRGVYVHHLHDPLLVVLERAGSERVYAFRQIHQIQ